MHTNPVAISKLANVFVFNPSPKKYHVNKAITIIPVPKPTNLPGHNKPSNPSTINFVAIIRMYDIGNPNNAIVPG